MARLRRERPGLEVEIITATRQLNLHQSGFDLAVAGGSAGNPTPVHRVLTDIPAFVLLYRRVSTGSGLTLHVDELRHHTVVFASNPCCNSATSTSATTRPASTPGLPQ
ncbi:LysR substrate-binding domain-containing protein [Mycolicibacterium wolinskyi]|uniref:LysR substrate-binding domain-containing protein n=1 Tax=Mycolicibacterium wolinskyi TaxID=59750 RepID=UPI00399B6A73